MKKLNLNKVIIFLLFSLFILISACKKDNLSNEIKGLWKGRYTKVQLSGDFGWLMNIKEGNQLDIMITEGDTGPVNGTGTWELQGNNLILLFNTVDNPTVIGATAIFDSKNHKLIDGTYGSADQKTGWGTWYMDKQP